MLNDISAQDYNIGINLALLEFHTIKFLRLG